MLTFSVSSLAFKCVFYRPEHSVNGRPHEIEFWTSYIVKWNILTNIAQRVD